MGSLSFPGSHVWKRREMFPITQSRADVSGGRGGAEGENDLSATITSCGFEVVPRSVVVLPPTDLS